MWLLQTFVIGHLGEPEELPPGHLLLAGVPFDEVTEEPPRVLLVGALPPVVRYRRQEARRDDRRQHVRLGHALAFAALERRALDRRAPGDQRGPLCLEPVAQDARGGAVVAV